MKSPTDFAAEKRKLTAEIFEITGQKVSEDDPIVTAAFFYSAMLRDAAKEVVKAREAAKENMATLAAEACQAEAIRLRKNLSTFAESLKQSIQSFAREGPASGVTGKSVWGIVSALVVIAVCGVFVGSYCFPSDERITPAQRQQMQVGREFMTILPHLDKTTRQRIANALEEQKKLQSK